MWFIELFLAIQRHAAMVLTAITADSSILTDRVVQERLQGRYGQIHSQGLQDNPQ